MKKHKVRHHVLLAGASFFLMGLALVVAISFSTSPVTPYSSELGVYDVSPEGESGGRSIPASCESAYEHWPGECYVPPPPVYGCTNPSATNYNPSATADDGTCTFPPVPVPGCTNSSATNYNPSATVDNGTCTFPPVPVPGCTNSSATNYNPAATVDNGTCAFPPPPPPPSPPAVTLYMSTNLQAETTSNSTIIEGEQVTLRWDSTNADTCSGVNFSTGGGSPADGSTGSVTEPSAGTATTYTVQCTGTSGVASDSIIVTKTAAGIPTIISTPARVRQGSTVTLTGDTSSNLDCNISGTNGFSASLAGVLGAYSQSTTAITSQTTFTITCGGGSNSTTVRILPIFWEI